MNSSALWPELLVEEFNVNDEEMAWERSRLASYSIARGTRWNRFVSDTASRTWICSV